MRTLLITLSYLGGNGGGVYASRTHINLFTELSERLTLLYPYKQGEEPRGINCEKIELVPIEDFRSKVRKFFDLIRGKVHRFAPDKSFFDSNKYDVVVFDSSVVSSGLVKKFKSAGIKVITIHHNYQIEYLLGDASLLTLLPSLFWTKIYEGDAVRYSDLNITLTQQDVELLKKHYGHRAKFEVLGVFEYQRNTPANIQAESRKHRYVMTGGLGSKQTEQSLIRWIERLYPILLKEDPNATLTIAGSNPSAKLAQIIEQNGIKLVSSPPIMEPILQNADFYINPVDCGGGLKLRNLDGLKYGLPVLTHKVSLRGYEKMADQGVIFSYVNQEEFAEGVKNIMALGTNRKDIQEKYLSQYQFDMGLKRLTEILKKNDLLELTNS